MRRPRHAALAAVLLATALASGGAPAPAGASVSDNSPNQAQCDNGSVTHTWQGIGLDRPLVASMTVDGQVVASPENPVDGGLGVAICAQMSNARKVGLQVVRRQGGDYHQDLTGALSPNGDPVTEATDITITLNDLGDNAEHFTFALVTGEVDSWTTTGLGTAAATLSFTASPRTLPLVDFADPGAQFCSATPPVCTVAQSVVDITTLALQLDMDPAGAFTTFRGAYFGLDGAISGFVQPRDGSFEVTLGAPHFEDDGSTLNVGAMQLFLPDATVESVLGLAPGSADASSISVTRTESGATADAPFTVTAAAGGIRIAVSGVTFSTPTYAISASAGFVPVAPVRLLNTRPAGQVGYTGTKPGDGARFELQVTGVAPANVPADAEAVVLNVTAVDPDADGYVTVDPCTGTHTRVSTLNVRTGVTRPNLAIVALDGRGKVCFYAERGTHLLADLAGYFPAGSDFVPLSPDRALDTRPGAPIGYTGAKPAAGDDFGFVPSAASAVVPADAEAVVLNVAGVAPTADGFVTVYPCLEPRPDASNLNLQQGETAANLVIVRPGSNGKVCVYTERGSHFIADVAGYFPAGSSFVPVVPERLLDTRPATRKGYTGDKPAADGSPVVLQVTGVGTANVPADATSVVLNVTGVDPSGDGYVTVYPCTPTRPDASNLNLRVGVNQPNLVVVDLDAQGRVCLYTERGTHLLADVAGSFGG